MKIVKVRKGKVAKEGNYGNIMEVMFDDGQTATIEQAIEMAENDQIEGVTTSHIRGGKKLLRSLPDSDKSNNLDNLPEF